MKTCTSCGITCPDGDKFCASCGGALKETVKAPEAKAPEAKATEAKLASFADSPRTTGMSADNFKDAVARIFKHHWPVLAALIGYGLSWVEGFAILGTIVAVLAGTLCWVKDGGKPVCKSLPEKIIASAIAILSIYEIIKYSVL